MPTPHSAQGTTDGLDGPCWAVIDAIWSASDPSDTAARLPSQLPADSRMLRYEDRSSCASSDWTGSTSIGLPDARSFV